MANIIYDIEKLEKAKDAIDKLAEALETENEELTKALAALQEEWNTEAGKKFFEEHKDTWSNYVAKYVQKITGISDMLKKAIEEYNNIANEVTNLKV